MIANRQLRASLTDTGIRSLVMSGPTAAATMQATSQPTDYGQMTAPMPQPYAEPPPMSYTGDPVADAEGELAVPGAPEAGSFLKWIAIGGAALWALSALGRRR